MKVFSYYRVLLSLGISLIGNQNNSYSAAVNQVSPKNLNLGNLCQDISPANNPSPLLWSAAQSGNLQEVQQTIICHHADPNSTDALGRTALHLAAEADNVPIITFLLQNGANPNQKSNEGLTPADIALEAGNQSIVQLLAQQGGQITINQQAQDNQPNNIPLPNASNTINQRTIASSNRAIDNRAIVTRPVLPSAGLPMMPPVGLPGSSLAGIPPGAPIDPALDFSATPTDQREAALRESLETSPFINNLRRPADKNRAEDIIDLLPAGRIQRPFLPGLIPNDIGIAP